MFLTLMLSYIGICVTFFSADIISCVEFNQDGDLLATGDKGGRVVIFQRDPAVRPLTTAAISYDPDLVTNIFTAKNVGTEYDHLATESLFWTQVIHVFLCRFRIQFQYEHHQVTHPHYQVFSIPNLYLKSISRNDKK